MIDAENLSRVRRGDKYQQQQADDEPAGDEPNSQQDGASPADSPSVSTAHAAEEGPATGSKANNA